MTEKNVCFQRMTREKLDSLVGCVEWWEDKNTPEYNCMKPNAWEALATALLYKYKFKSPDIKSIKDICNYDGTRTIKIYRRYGVQIFQFIDR